MDGALGDVRDRSGRGKANLSRWTLQGCSARDQPRRGGSSIVECGSEDDVSTIENSFDIGRFSLDRMNKISVRTMFKMVYDEIKIDDNYLQK